jgi:CubicO group peptidase (beta-lactamase class C family)
MNALSEMILGEIAAGSFPGAQYAVAEERVILAEAAHGSAVLTPQRIPATLDTIYDLASLTKPLVTALLCVLLSERRTLDLKNPIARFFGEFDVHDKRQVTLSDLLTHTSGLPRWRPLYCDVARPDQVVSAISRLPVEHGRVRQPKRPGHAVIYSDLNYIVAGRIIEAVTGDTLENVALREIFAPLGLASTMFNPVSGLRPRIAASERGRAHEKAVLADFGCVDANSGAVASGDEIIWGAVHDGNASFLGGVAGHAGLFSTAREVVALASQFLPGSSLVNSDSLNLFTRDLTSSGADSMSGSLEARSIGWLLASTPDCSAGPGLPPIAFGHNGFTGTSVWIDPLRRRTYVLLTNRVHPTISSADMKAIRRRFHALAAQVTG